jgi:hypothetical protein
MQVPCFTRDSKSSAQVLLAGRKEEKMYTGILIDELMATVERTEKHAIHMRSQEEKLAYFYSVAQSELVQYESNLAGVA